MSTLAALQQLSDTEFHRLCDELLERLEPRYAGLTPHGLNPEGKSIKGKPDSYIGASATTCRIAFEYSTESDDWWNKIIRDVRDVAQACPLVEEIVVATPRDVDREGPKRRPADWLGDAKDAAGGAILTTFHGRTLANHLDTDRLDLRFRYLKIPYSRLSRQGIMESSRAASLRTLEDLKWIGRYDPDRYVKRTADRDLYQIWQQAYAAYAGITSPKGTIRLVALVNDSGVGKTSLLCSFVESTCQVLPVLLVEAHNLSFEGDDSLVKHVVHALQGMLDPALRRGEEAEIVRTLNERTPVTVILDGLDESKNPEAVRKAISFWLRSKLGQASILIISSRPEFWRICGIDKRWQQWMPKPLELDRQPTRAADRTREMSFDPMLGVKLPNQFSEPELEQAWTLTGRSRHELFALKPRILEELRHPFTLRSYLDLTAGSVIDLRLQTRADILEAWLNRRLELEVDEGDHVTGALYKKALCLLASKINRANSGWIAVDDLEGIPRFDRCHPPGAVVKRLISAGILQTSREDSSMIRFSSEAVLDYFVADNDVAKIASGPLETVLDSYGGTFSDEYTRLSQIGRKISRDGCRHEFVGGLADRNPAKAAVVLSAKPDAYDPSLKKRIVDGLRQELESRYKAVNIFGVELLSILDCPESHALLLERLLPLTKCPPHLRVVGGVAVAKLGLIEGLQLIYELPGLGGMRQETCYFFRDMLSLLRGARPDFRVALGDQAVSALNCESGTDGHWRAACLLGYLADDRLADHLRERLDVIGILYAYENHALIALGTKDAAKVFARSVRIVASRIREIPVEKDRYHAREQLFPTVSHHTADIEYLMTPEFAQTLVDLIHDRDEEVSRLAIDVARTSQFPALMYETMRSPLCRSESLSWSLNRLERAIDPETWLHWWEVNPQFDIRKNLLYLNQIIADVRVEEKLIECLDVPELRGYAARQLGGLGSYRAVNRLRSIVADESASIGEWERAGAESSLGLLRDQRAVPFLEKVISSTSHLSRYALHSLGEIGTPEAESALNRLLVNGIDEKEVASALLFHGSPSAVSKAIELASRKDDGPKWLADRLHWAFSKRGYRFGTYYHHIHLVELIPYLRSGERLYQPNEMQKFLRTVERVDGDLVRGLLREWAGRRGTHRDIIVRENDGLRFSYLAYLSLLDRSDDSVVETAVDLALSEKDSARFRHVSVEQLERLSSPLVARELRLRFASTDDSDDLARLVALLGRFGVSNDQQYIAPYLDHPDDRLANLAYEAICRLTDPLRIPRG